ncbi:hypothetical protein CLV40_116114 [Actinokineospora auranticolor]|uniref:Uncharacterized protein n=1 Tax=Actinokineospora auranticolor TaxID=155976 RepID=A0A2S6GIU0_9PSEU|nr:hypothetical protein CLV40_116114 [Actinokineospora auranticolor]
MSSRCSPNTASYLACRERTAAITTQRLRHNAVGHVLGATCWVQDAARWL